MKEARTQPIRAVAGIVYRLTSDRRYKLLLIKKQGGYWTLPKGKLKRNEADEVGLLREIFEETGVCGEVGEVVAQAEYPVYKGRRSATKTVVYYLVRYTDGVAQPGRTEAIEKVRWLSITSALQHIGRSHIRTVVRAAQTMLGGS